jgi:hypothetical protein
VLAGLAPSSQTVGSNMRILGGSFTVYCRWVTSLKQVWNVGKLIVSQQKIRQQNVGLMNCHCTYNWSTDNWSTDNWSTTTIRRQYNEKTIGIQVLAGLAPSSQAIRSNMRILRSHLWWLLHSLLSMSYFLRASLKCFVRWIVSRQKVSWQNVGQWIVTAPIMCNINI